MRARWIGRQAFLVLLGLVFGAVIFKGENFLECLFIDLRFFLLSSSHAQERQSDRVAIIKMDAASENALGLPYGPKWRQFYPAIIQTLNEAGASLIAFDSMFLDKEDQWDPRLAAAAAKAGNVVAGEDGVRPTRQSLRGSFLAIGNLTARLIGGEPRFVKLAAPEGSGLKPLSVVAVEEYERRVRGASLDSRFAHPPGFWINYRDAPDYFPSFSFVDVLNAKEGRIGGPARTPISVFANRIVLIGLDDPTSGTDRFPYPNTLGRDLPGVYGHAYAAETILQNRPVTRASPWADAGIAAVFIALLLLVLGIRPRKWRAVLAAALPVGAFVLYLALLSRVNLWLGFAPLFVAFWAVLIPHWVLLRISLSSSLRRAVGFDPRLIETFRRERSRSGGQVRKDVTILIADVRDYTRYVSRTDPATVSRVMTDYMAAMEQCITALGGYVNKYVGDEVVAVFGFPLDEAQTAQRAVRAAMGMLHELDRLVASWQTGGLPGVEHIGIGVDTGTVGFAEVGGRTRNQLDIIGDCINGASRIEHLTKEFGKSLLISEETCRALESDDGLFGQFQLVRSVTVRGQGERRVFGLVG